MTCLSSKNPLTFDVSWNWNFFLLFMFDQVERKGGNNQLCTTLHTILEWDQCPFSYFISVKQCADWCKFVFWWHTFKLKMTEGGWYIENWDTLPANILPIFCFTSNCPILQQCGRGSGRGKPTCFSKEEISFKFHANFQQNTFGCTICWTF